MKKIKIFTDGAAKGNPGNGGYGCVLIYEKENGEIVHKCCSGGYKMTTNNRMEILAAIIALEQLKEPCMVELYSDSKYLVDAFNQNWIDKWESNGWKRNKKDLVKNIDLWERLLEAKKTHIVSFKWVKGHNGNHYNEICDYLATSASNRDEKDLLDDIGYVKGM